MDHVLSLWAAEYWVLKLFYSNKLLFFSIYKMSHLIFYNKYTKFLLANEMCSIVCVLFPGLWSCLSLSRLILTGEFCVKVWCTVNLHSTRWFTRCHNVSTGKPSMASSSASSKTLSPSITKQTRELWVIISDKNSLRSPNEIIKKE